MFILDSYRTDTGYVYYYVSLSFVVVIADAINTYEFEEILPNSVKVHVKDSEFDCQLGKLIRPRTLIINANDRNTYKSTIPFTGYSEEFYTMINELKASQLVESYQILGERLRYAKLKNLV